ncbi:MAG TPA: 6-hydroxymethylpterin diphosphokinase MptE-like protein [Candidatus Limnocylindrales bacterium]|nr:6-hydroxymethylpterin diphosphokinase MptE-like protein [Candidatus Limnocylindrales bacterium]
MKLELNDWRPWYRRIIETFGYDQAKDQYAADLLSTLLTGKAADVSLLKKRVENRPALVFGAGPSLEENLKQVLQEGALQEFVTLVADGATTAFLHVSKAAPDVIVTDLDGIVSDIVSAQNQGSVVVIHAHGDNIEQLKRYVPDFSSAIGSTQVEPRPNVHNFLGFTDGDRAVFLAAAMDAKLIVLAGMDFGSTVGKYSKQQVKSLAVKREKLRISKELLEWLAQRLQGSIGLCNMTANGEKIKGFRNIHPEDLKELV